MPKLGIISIGAESDSMGESRVPAWGMLWSRVPAQGMPVAPQHPTVGPQPGRGGCVGARRSHGACPALILLMSAVSRCLEQLQLDTTQCHRLVPLPTPGEGMVQGAVGGRE